MFKKTEFQEAFQLFDSRGDGKIHVAQIGDALRALGQNPTESDVKKCTLHLKPDERISFEVFLPIYQVREIIKSGCPMKNMCVFTHHLLTSIGTLHHMQSFGKKVLCVDNSLFFNLL